MMQAREINEWFWGLPGEIHFLALALLIVLYAHLFLGFWMVRHRLPKHVVKYFIGRTVLVFMLILFKSEYLSFGMLDTFYPIYLLSYVDGLIILNGFGFYRCKGLIPAFKKISKFNSTPKKDAKSK